MKLEALMTQISNSTQFQCTRLLNNLIFLPQATVVYVYTELDTTVFTTLMGTYRMERERNAVKRV